MQLCNKHIYYNHQVFHKKPPGKTSFFVAEEKAQKGKEKIPPQLHLCEANSQKKHRGHNKSSWHRTAEETGRIREIRATMQKNYVIDLMRLVNRFTTWQRRGE